MDCVLIAILSIRIQNENRQTATTNTNGVGAIPIPINATENIINEMINGFLLSNLETNHPEMGKPIKELMGMANSTVPSSASLKWNMVFIVGIREAHVAKLIPVKKNIHLALFAA